MVISLPSNLSGCVHITDINPVYTSLLEDDDSNNEVMILYETSLFELLMTYDSDQFYLLHCFNWLSRYSLCKYKLYKLNSILSKDEMFTINSILQLLVYFYGFN